MKILKILFFYRIQSFKIIYRYLIFLISQKLFFKHFIETKIHNYQMLIPLKYDGIGRALYMYKTRENDQFWMINKEVFNGANVLDLGGNIGYYTLMLAKKAGTKGKVFCVEPDPRNIKILKKNIELNSLNKTIYLSECAISNINKKKIKFYLSSKTNLNSFTPKANKKNMNYVELDKIDFCTYIKNKPRLDFVRMDIEGHELEVFQSIIRMSKKLKNKLPKNIIFETHTHLYSSKIKSKKIFENLFKIGYKIKYFSSSDELKTSLHSENLKRIKKIKDHLLFRGIYKFSNEFDIIDHIANNDDIRTVFLKL
jgi:FkbM family methyltransferase